MKKTLTLILLSLPSIAFSQGNPEQQAQAMLGDFASKMNQVQACQNKVDKAKFERFKQQSQINDTKIEALCIENRDRAEEIENAFTEKAMKDPELYAMMMCISNVWDDDSGTADNNDSEGESHTCD